MKFLCLVLNFWPRLYNYWFIAVFCYRPICHSNKLSRFYSTQQHIWKTLAQAHLCNANLFCTGLISDQTFQN